MSLGPNPNIPPSSAASSGTASGTHSHQHTAAGLGPGTTGSVHGIGYPPAFPFNPWSMYPGTAYPYPPFPFYPAPFHNLPGHPSAAPTILPAPNATIPHSGPAAKIEVIPDSSTVPSTRWPDGNFKVDCLVSELPPDWNDEGWAWRSSGSRRHGLPSDAYSVNKNRCLGVYHCACRDSSGKFSRLIRPKKEKRSREAQQNDRCLQCRTNLVHIPCDASYTTYNYEDTDAAEHIVRQHEGYHSHARPPTKRLSAAETLELDVQVRQNPTQTAQQLRVGAELGQTPLGVINPALFGSRKARSEVERSKIRLGIVAPTRSRQSGFDLVDTMSSLRDMFQTPFIIKSELIGGQFVVMQTPFMRDVLLRDQIESWSEERLEVESGRHGLPTDGCHDFFKRGVLLTSLVFSPTLLRWCPVLYTWIGQLDEAHHKSHFDQLLPAIAEIQQTLRNQLTGSYIVRPELAMISSKGFDACGHVDPKFGGTKPQPKSHIQWHENDGRAPDTRARLDALNRLEAESTVRAADLTQDERFTACNMPEAIKKNADQPPLVSPSSLVLQSYKWDSMSCFLDASLEALYRSFTSLSTTQRSDLMALIRTDAASTGLRDIFEHFWTRGIASGEWSSSYLHGKNFRNTSRPSMHWLNACLYFGQQRAKLLLSRIWDGGDRVDGQPGCCRTWMNQMLRIDTTLAIQNQFGIGYQVHFTCKAHMRHQTTQFIRPKIEFGLHRDDILIAQASSDGRATLQDYFLHFIPRDSFQGKTAQPLHQSLPIHCEDGSHCASDSTVTSIVVEFPLILRIGTGMLADNPNENGFWPWKGVDCQCPVFPQEFTIGPVNYKLVSAVKFVPGGVGHFISTVVINDVVYSYDDTRHNGTLQKIGPLSDITNWDFSTNYVIYVRTTKESRLNRSVEEIEQDYTKIPSIDSQSNPYHIVDPTPVPDRPTTPTRAMPDWLKHHETPHASSDNQSSDFEMLGAITSSWDELEVERMIAETLDPVQASPAHIGKHLLSSMDKSPSPPPAIATLSGADEADSDSSDSELEMDSGKAVVEEGSTLRCDGCSEQAQFAKQSKRANGGLVPCESCRQCSHISCLDSDTNWLLDRVRFICKLCDNSHPGSILAVPYPATNDPDDSGSRFYPAVLVRRHVERRGQSDEYEFSWSEFLDGVLFNAPDRPTQLDNFFLPHATFVRYSNMIHKGRKKVPDSKIGTYRVPFYLNPKAEIHVNSNLAQVFSAAIPVVGNVLRLWDQRHVVIKAWIRYSREQRKKKKRLGPDSWASKLGLIFTEELDQTLGYALSRLMIHTTLADIPFHERNERVQSVGCVLFHLLFVQRELGEPFDAGGASFDDLRSESILACPPKHVDAVETAMFQIWRVRWNTVDELGEARRKFRANHCTYDAHHTWPVYHRVSGAAPLDAVVAVIPEHLRSEEEQEPAPPERPKPKPRKKVATVASVCKRSRAEEEQEPAAPERPKLRKDIVTVASVRKRSRAEEEQEEDLPAQKRPKRQQRKRAAAPASKTPAPPQKKARVTPGRKKRV
ncbi:unnamed protein product [Mycena citricolor]|uniref:GCM domain-containing protein n=1 Tax=Mycena citricolor TaxID=2018698 RepID=A0AAD2H416_9AGAR|nr:unnamed protein product [Mycena citricolor]